MRAALPLRLALPALEPFLAANVAKEARKDELVIRRAGEALAAGEAPGSGAARQLLAAAREIDREFLAGIGGIAARIDVRYDRIEPLRVQRMELGLDCAYRMLDAWRRGRRLREAFAAGEIERRLFELLQLYAAETQALSHSVRLPRILEPARERIAQRLQAAMLHAAQALTRAAPAAAQNG